MALLDPGVRPFCVGALVVLGLLCGLCSRASGGEWRGWRGLEREGRADSPKAPIHWAPDRNVLWKTPVPGKGHSSPVVSGDNVVVTTGFFTGKGQTLKRGIADGVLALTALLPILAAPFVVRCSRLQPRLPRWQFFSVACLCFMLGLLIALSFAARSGAVGGEISTEQRMELWLFSSQIASLCLLLGTLLFEGRSWWRLPIGLAAVALSGLVVLGRPLPGYFDLRTPGRYGPETYQSVAIPLGLGIVLLLGMLLRRGRTPDAKGAAKGRPSLLRLTAAGGALVLGFVASKAPVLAAMGLCIIAWLVVEVGDLRPRWAGLPRWFALAALFVGALGFIEENYLLVTKEFVRAIVCVDRSTGAVKWVREGLRGSQPTMNVRNSPATPTPVIDAGRIYAWFGTAGCVCTGLDGNVLWTNKDVPFEDAHGVGASPVVVDGLLIIVSAQPEAPYIRALDCQAGKPVWTTKLRPWPGSEGQHRTPTVKLVDGKSALLIWGWDGPDSEDYLRAYDVRSGAELWKFPLKTPKEAVASIISDDDTLYLLSSEGLSALSFSKLSRGEDPVQWVADVKGEGQFVASPVLCKGMLFVVTSHRDARCVDAGTGEVLWRERLRGRGFLASPVAVGDHVYFCDNSGLTTVVACERDFRRVAENRLSERVFASPAPVDGHLFVRTTKHLWCLGERGSAEAAQDGVSEEAARGSSE